MGENAMTDSRCKERKDQVERYRGLERETSEPLAAFCSTTPFLNWKLV